jgi:DNA-binding transcriptional ArsR family regulator
VLDECIQACSQIDLTQLSRLEATRLITGQELTGEKAKHISKLIDSAERLVFIPSVHAGPYVWNIHLENALGIVFGARVPKGVQVDVPDLSRTEILVRLGALADDTRLSILRFIAEHGEQRSPDLIGALNLSQSAASRHLTQLSATGYLTERRCEGAKCYALNSQRVEETLQAVAAFLRSGGGGRYQT